MPSPEPLTPDCNAGQRWVIDPKIPTQSTHRAPKAKGT
jgi:hypothetical protein